MTINLDKICRTCMAESFKLVSIWTFDAYFPKKITNKENSHDAPSLATMFSAITSLNVSIDCIISCFKIILPATFLIRSKTMANYQEKCA